MSSPSSPSTSHSDSLSVPISDLISLNDTDHEKEQSDGIHSDWSPSSNDEEEEEEGEEVREREEIEDYDMLASLSWSEGGISTIESSNESHGTGNDSRRSQNSSSGKEEEDDTSNNRMRLSFPDPLTSMDSTTTATTTSLLSPQKDKIRRSTITASTQTEEIDPEDTTDYSFILDSTTSTSPSPSMDIVADSITTLPLLSSSTITTSALIKDEITPTSSSILTKSIITRRTKPTRDISQGREISDISKWVESSGSYSGTSRWIKEKKVVDATHIKKEEDEEEEAGKKFNEEKKIFTSSTLPLIASNAIPVESATQTDTVLISSEQVDKKVNAVETEIEVLKVEEEKEEKVKVPVKIKKNIFYPLLSTFIGLSSIALYLLSNFFTKSSPTSSPIASFTPSTATSTITSITALSTTVLSNSDQIAQSSNSPLSTSTSTSSSTSSMSSSTATSFHLKNCLTIGPEACAVGILEFYPNLLKIMLENISKEDLEVVEDVVMEKRKREESVGGEKKKKEVKEKKKIGKKVGVKVGKKGSRKIQTRKIKSIRDKLQRHINNTSFPSFNSTILPPTHTLYEYLEILKNFSSTATSKKSIDHLHQILYQILHSSKLHRARKSAQFLIKKIQSRFQTQPHEILLKRLRYEMIKTRNKYGIKLDQVQTSASSIEDRIKNGIEKIRMELIHQNISSINLLNPLSNFTLASVNELNTFIKDLERDLKVKKDKILHSTKKVVTSKIKKASKGWNRIKSGEVKKHLNQVRHTFGKKYSSPNLNCMNSKRDSPCLVKSKDRRWRKGCVGFGST